MATASLSAGTYAGQEQRMSEFQSATSLSQYSRDSGWDERQRTSEPAASHISTDGEARSPGSSRPNQDPSVPQLSPRHFVPDFGQGGQPQYLVSPRAAPSGGALEAHSKPGSELAPSNSPGYAEGQPIDPEWQLEQLLGHIDALELELRDTKDRLNGFLADDEVMQVQFRAGQEELDSLKQRLFEVEGKLAERARQYEALEQQAAQQKEDSNNEMDKLRAQLKEARSRAAEAEERLIQALASAADTSAESGSAEQHKRTLGGSGDFSGVATQQLESQKVELNQLRSQLEEHEDAAWHYKAEIQALSADLQSARTLQEELLAAADEERTAREKATSELQKALAHTARMQALGDAALEETGTVSEQVFALQEDLIEKDQMIRAIEHERQLLLHELEEMQARLLHDDVGQQRQLMDAAASELSKLKSHNLQLQEEMSTLQEQLAQRDAYGTDFMSNSNMSVQPASDHMSVQPASEQLEAALREETRLLHQCEQQLASTQQQNAQLEERIQGQIREMDAIHGDLLRHQEASQQQHATMRQLELELIENQERLRESDWQLRAAQSESAQLARELQLARDEALWHQSGSGGVLESNDNAIATMEASLHQVEMELAREREQWHERQEMHRAEAEALRQQLQRLQGDQEALIQQLHPAAGDEARARGGFEHATGSSLHAGSNGGDGAYGKEENFISPPPITHPELLDRIRQLEGQLEATTHEKFALHDQLLSSQASLAAMQSSASQPPPDLLSAGNEQLQRAREAKMAADHANQEARALMSQAADQARQARGDMLVMAKQLVSLHAVVDSVMAALDGISDGLRVQGAAEQRRNLAAAFEAQRLQQALDDAYALLDDARSKNAAADTSASKSQSFDLVAQELLSGALESMLRSELASLDSTAIALADLRYPPKALMSLESRTWQAGLITARQPSSPKKAQARPTQLLSVAGGSLAPLLPKGDFMELASASSPTARRLLAKTAIALPEAIGCDNAMDAPAAVQLKQNGQERAVVSGLRDACDTLLELRTSLLLLLQLRSSISKFVRRRERAHEHMGFASLQQNASNWNRHRTGASLLLARVQRRLTALSLTCWAQLKGTAWRGRTRAERALRRYISVQAAVLRRVLAGWKARSWRLCFRKRQVVMSRQKRVLSVALSALAAWKTSGSLSFVRNRAIYAMILRRSLKIVCMRFLEWKISAASSCAPSSSALKMIVSKYGRGDVRGALNQWNNNVSWKWTPEYRRFWNNMRRFDRLFMRIMLHWRRLWARAQWTQHVAACRVRHRVETAYIRSTFFSWARATWPQQVGRDSRTGPQGSPFQYYD